MSNYLRHPYHLVDESPWPILASMGGFILTTGFVEWFFLRNFLLAGVGLVILFIRAYQWWRDIVREATYQGFHTKRVELGIRWGIILFIVSEIFFFLSFFWAFFHSRLRPRECLGGFWPPRGIKPFDCFKVPLLNTLILLSSGVSVTWAHHAIMGGEVNKRKWGLVITVFLGVYFTGVQGLEYMESSFCISDRAYGSTFFLATGFHGLHVLVGTVFLVVTLVRHLHLNFRGERHFGFEAASWYWHFVDVVWLFLFVVVYWWGGEVAL